MGVTNYCSPSWLQSAIDSQTAILIDCQSQSDYDKTHITGAIRVNLPAIVLRRLQKGTITFPSTITCCSMKEKFVSECKSKTIVLCNIQHDCKIVQDLFQLMTKDNYHIKILKGFQEFVQSFPSYTSGKQTESSSDLMIGMQGLRLGSSQSCDGENSKIPSILPHKIIDRLYLGNARSSADKSVLQKLNIRYILNVTQNEPNVFESSDDIKYMKIPVQDHWSQNLSSFFPEAIRFIDNARNEGSSVLVHCLAGISRSCTITVAYLMHHCCMSLNEAYDHVKQAKPDISPNLNFMGQLLEYEKSLNSHKCQCSEKNSRCTICQPGVQSSSSFFTSPLPIMSPLPVNVH